MKELERAEMLLPGDRDQLIKYRDQRMRPKQTGLCLSDDETQAIITNEFGVTVASQPIGYILSFCIG